MLFLIQFGLKKQSIIFLLATVVILIQYKIIKLIISSRVAQMSTIMKSISKLSARQSSITDLQQQLRVLISLLDQYNHQFQQIMIQNKDTIEQATNFQIFIEILKVKGEADIKILYDGLKSLKRISQQVLQKCLHTLPDVMRQLQTSRGRMQHFQQQIDDKDLIIEGLKQKKAQIQKNLGQINMLYQKSRHDNMQLSKQITIKQHQFETESRQIRKTFLQVTQSSEMEKKILQQMYESNQKLSANLAEIKNQKKIIEKQLQKINQQLGRTNKKLNSLQTQLQRKDTKIRQYEAQIQSIHNSRRKNSGDSHPRYQPQQQQAPQLRQSFNEQLEEKRDDKIKLNEQLHNYKLPTVKQLNGSFIMGSAIRRSVGQESDYASQYEEATKINKSFIHDNKQEQPMEARPKKNRKQVTDPYFSHYILTSQSVKINEDCEDMLSIDMKPYYLQIIEKRIPMHLWDQWIRIRLRQLFKQSKND